MTTFLDKAITAVRDWPAERQDEAAEMLLGLYALSDPYVASPE
jgi:hypothetical protein